MELNDENINYFHINQALLQYFLIILIYLNHLNIKNMTYLPNPLFTRGIYSRDYRIVKNVKKNV